MFAPCASLRLYFPALLPEYNQVLYVDTDVIFMDSPALVWDQFKHFDANQLAGMSRENLVER